jgi:murein DD-endopeptidase MepM/ murein hydrolase activator NlpD
MNVELGQWVVGEQQISEMGDTGKSSNGSHLHFELYLPERKSTDPFAIFSRSSFNSYY